MATERDDEQFGKEEAEFGQNQQQPTGQQSQQPTGQQGQQSEFGQQNQSAEFGQQQGQSGGLGYQPSMSGQDQSGQDNFGSQSQGQSGGQSSSGQTDLQPGSDIDTLSGEQSGSGQSSDSTSQSGGSGSGGSQGGSGGFVGSQGTASDEYLQDSATGGSDFASQGQGALDEPDEDIETGQSNSRENDVEGGSGNI